MNFLLIAFEVLILAAVIYAFFRFLQETRGSAVLKGFILLIILLALLLVTLVDALDLRHLQFLARNSLQFFLISLIVLFQPEIRQALVKLGETPLMRRLTKETRSRSVVDEVTQAAERLSRRGLGAIIVVERSVGIAGFTEGGVQMDSLVSAPLLLSIFITESPLHDGAVVIRGRRIAAAGCLLPLSENPNLSKTLGTRHRAALGITEESDAIAVVVSEETSRITVAHRGELEIGVTPDRLRELLEEMEEEVQETIGVGAGLMGAPKKAKARAHQTKGVGWRRAPILTHPVASVLSLLMAALLVFVIDRQLEEVLFEGEVEIVFRDTGQGNQLVVQVPRDYVARLPKSDAVERAELVVRGAKNLKRNLPTAPTVVASIPIERVQDHSRQWKRVTVEAGSDLSIPEVEGVTFNLEPDVRVDVAKLRTLEVTLVPEVEPGDDGWKYTADVQTSASVEVTGPMPELDRLERDGARLSPRLPRRQELVTLEELTLPDGTHVRPERRVQVRVTRQPVEGSDSLQLSDVPFVYTVPPQGEDEESAYEFELPERNVIKTVTLRGPPNVVARFKGDRARLDELRRKLRVILLIDRAVEENKAAIESAGTRGYPTDVRGVIDPLELRQEGFTTHDRIAELITIKPK